MKVEILNPELLSEIYKNHGIFACECYNTPEKYAEKVGEACQESGHYSGSRTEYIKLRISGVDRGTLEQVMRTEIGSRKDNIEDVVWMEQNLDLNPTTVVKNMKSFRYVDMKKFDYTTPKLIQRSKRAREIYDNLMLHISAEIAEISSILNEDFPNVDSKAILEASQFPLPRATNTSLVLGFTIESLIKYMWKRLCVRTQPEHGELAKRIMDEILRVKPEFESKLQPHCEHLLWCPEGKMTCGMFPTREQLIKKLK